MEGEFYYGRHLTSIGKHDEAIKLYKSAANKGDIPSTFRLGLSLIKGKGVPIDIPSGYKYLITAADHGHIFALREIGVLDIKGNRGIMYSIKGFWVFLYAIILGIFEGYFIDRHSVKLRG